MRETWRVFSGQIGWEWGGGIRGARARRRWRGEAGDQVQHYLVLESVSVGRLTYLAFFKQVTTSGGSSFDVTLALEFDMLTRVIEICFDRDGICVCAKPWPKLLCEYVGETVDC